MATKYNIKIGLLGATFDTGNLGVNAIAESAIKCILHKWPDAEITLLDSGQKVEEEKITIGDKELLIKKVPIRFCKNIFLENHFIVLCFYALLFNLIRSEKFRRFCARRNSALNHMTQMDLVADITAGDSFSDIYGMRRFILGFLRKWLVLLFNKDLIMLPQTYGPFKSRLSRSMARYVLNRSSVIYSRDHEGIEYLKTLLNSPQNSSQNGKVKFTPDVAFVLDSQKPGNLDVGSLFDVRDVSSVVVGLNVSGLLYCGGYTKNNMFGLRSNYRELIYAIIEMLLKNEGVSVLLIPHVFTPAGYVVESDPEACQKIYEQLRQIYSGRIFLVKGEYNQNEIKYIIGLCDFFIGSRMHACIAALSQGIPAVGLAYSKKFWGVFESVGAENLVIDLRQHEENEIFAAISDAFENRVAIADHLRRTVPGAQARILNIFKNFE